MPFTDNRLTVSQPTAGSLNVTATGTITAVTNITNWGNIVDDAAITPASTRVLMTGYMADETATDSVDEGDGGMARMTSTEGRLLRVTCSMTQHLVGY